MSFGTFHINLSELGTALLGIAAVITALKGGQKAKEKARDRREKD